MSKQHKIPGAGGFRALALHALHRRLSGGWALLVLLAALMLGTSLPAAANECRLADANSNGEHVGEICWFQFGAVDEDLLSGTTTDVPFEFDLPDGSRVELNVTISGGSAANPRLTVHQAPTWTGSNFSGNSDYYTILMPNAAALHSPDGRGNRVELVFSDVRLYAPDGSEVTDLPFEIVVADAERLNSNPQEYLDFGVVSGGSQWTLLEWLGNAPATAVQQGTPATLDPGVASACQGSDIDCLRFKGVTGGDANAVVLSSRKIVGSAQPFTVMGQIHSTAGQGFAVGMRCCELRLRKSLPEGRADPADQFTYRIVNANGDTVSTDTTSGAASGAYPFIGTMAMSGNALTLVEEMAPGSVSSLSAYERHIVCVNPGSGETVLDEAYDPASPPAFNSLQMGDLVECDISNTPLPRADLSVQKTVDPENVQSGDEVVYTLEVTNNGPAAADGAVVTDPGVPDSLACTALTCAAAAGAACPAGAPTPAQLAAGLAIPALPAGGTIILEMTCTVTATGN